MARKGVRKVVFVGAGASRAFGYALTSEILPELWKRLKANKLGIGEEESRVVRRVVRGIVPGIDQALAKKQELPLITDILSLFDYCILNGEELGVLRATATLHEVRQLLDRAIVEILNTPIHRPSSNPNELVRRFRADLERGNHVTVISTNYDVTLDIPIFERILGNWMRNYDKIDFGFSWRDPDDGEIVPPPRLPQIALYKLHGSLNWLKCGRCGFIYVNFIGSIADLPGRRTLGAYCHCGHEPLRTELVTPSFIREVRDRSLLSIWKSAGEALRLATEWTFIGYSLPPEDVAIRSLLVRSFLGHGGARPKVRVVGRTDQVGLRYRMMFPRSEYTVDGLEGFLNEQCSWR
jgi:hypothetical protein